MSSTTTISEVNEVLKALRAEIKVAIKDMSSLSVEKSKLETKLGKTETKLDEAKAKVKAGGKKVAAATATAEASNSAAATVSSSASESSSVSSGPLTITEAKGLPQVQRLVAMLDQLDELTGLVKVLAKPVKTVRAPDAEPKGPTNAHIAWQPSTLYPEEWAAFKLECQPAKDAIKARIAALAEGHPDLDELKKRQRTIGSVMAFNTFCRETSHKTDWVAFQAAWAVEHPKKAMGGGGSM